MDITRLELMKMKVEILKLKANDHNWECYTPQNVRDELEKVLVDINKELEPPTPKWTYYDINGIILPNKEDAIYYHLDGAKDGGYKVGWYFIDSVQLLNGPYSTFYNASCSLDQYKESELGIYKE